MSEFEKLLRGYKLTTADIYYHMPDRPSLLQEYVWQEFDLPPRFPQLNRYLEFWQSKLDGKLHSIWVACAGASAKSELKLIGREYRLH